MTQRSKFKSKQAQRYLEYKQVVGWTAKEHKVTQSHKDVRVSARAHIHLGTRDMDVDNLAKSLLDGLNGIAWIDDKQVMHLTVEKVFVPREFNEMVEITISEIA